MKNFYVLLLISYFCTSFLFAQNPQDLSFDCNTPIDLPPKLSNERGFGKTHAAWPRQFVPYKLEDDLTPGIVQEFLKAIQYFEDQTNICFRPVLAERTPLRIHKSDKNYYWSNRIGYTTGDNNAIYIGLNQSVILHEIGHAVGLYHEHQRPDRDSFVIISEANIQDGRQGNFRKLSGFPGVSLTEYDFNSVMHYSAYAFTNTPGSPTILRKDGGEELEMGGKELSEKDIEVLAMMYPLETDCDQLALERAPLANFQVESANDLCALLEIQMQNTSIGNYTRLRWEFPGAINPTAESENPKVIYPEPGTYTVRLTAQNQYGQSKKIISIKVKEGQDRINGTIYPNPNMEDFRINLENSSQQLVQFKLFQFDGKEVYREKRMLQPQCLGPVSFSLPQDLPKGMYFYQVLVGNSSKLGKFSLQR